MSCCSDGPWGRRGVEGRSSGARAVGGEARRPIPEPRKPYDVGRDAFGRARVLPFGAATMDVLW